MKICIFADPRIRRSVEIADALRKSAHRLGWKSEVVETVHKEPRGDLIAGYGWRNREIFEAYRKAGLHYLYFDLGYWGRKKSRSDVSGYHKAVFDARHATGYFRRGRPHDRMAGAPEIVPWNGGGTHIIVAGLSAKAAMASDRGVMEWEHETIAKLRQITRRPIVYRPKPSWKAARPVDGTIFSPRSQLIGEVLQSAHALVTLHSNAALDALAAGVPIYAEEGVGSVMSMRSLDQIEHPPYPEGREQLFADVGYCHWSVPEIANGTMWAQFMADGMIG